MIALQIGAVVAPTVNEVIEIRGEANLNLVGLGNDHVISLKSNLYQEMEVLAVVFTIFLSDG